MEAHLAVARKMGITEEELAETIQLVSSVGAGSLIAMGRRAAAKSEPEGESKTLKIYLNRD